MTEEFTLLGSLTTRERMTDTRSSLSMSAFSAFQYLPEDNPMKVNYMNDEVIYITKLDKRLMRFINRAIRIPEIDGHYICRYDIGILITDELGHSILESEADKRP